MMGREAAFHASAVPPHSLVYLSAFLCFCPSVRPSIRRSVCLSVCLSLSLWREAGISCQCRSSVPTSALGPHACLPAHLRLVSSSLSPALTQSLSTGPDGRERPTLLSPSLFLSPSLPPSLPLSLSLSRSPCAVGREVKWRRGTHAAGAERHAAGGVADDGEAARDAEVELQDPSRRRLHPALRHPSPSARRGPSSPSRPPPAPPPLHALRPLSPPRPSRAQERAATTREGGYEPPPRTYTRGKL